QRIHRRTEAQLDLVGESGLLPKLPGDVGPFLAVVAGHDATVSGQGERHAERAVARERPHLQDPTCPDEADQEREEMALLRRDLHPRAGHRRGDVAQFRQERMLRRLVRQEIGTDGLVETVGYSRHRIPPGYFLMFSCPPNPGLNLPAMKSPMPSSFQFRVA